MRSKINNYNLENVAKLNYKLCYIKTLSTVHHNKKTIVNYKRGRKAKIKFDLEHTESFPWDI